MTAHGLTDGVDRRSHALEEGLAELALPTADATRRTLLAYLDLIVKWNRVHNLTAIRDPEQMVAHHLLDSLAIAPFVRGESLADIGSGAGLPGIPLAIHAPHRAVTLIESNGKKAAFLAQVAASLALANVTVAGVRAEAHAPARRFDCIVSRAFASLDLFAAIARPLLAPRGRLLAMKGTYPADEIARLPEGVRMVEARRLDVPQLAAERHLILLETD